MTRRATLPVTPGLSPAMEGYLKAIHLIDQLGIPVTTQALAQYLTVAPPSVTEMVKRLAGRGLVAHMPYRPITLAPTGQRFATNLAEQHALIAAFLVASLGYSENHASQDADAIEHALSDQSLAQHC